MATSATPLSAAQLHKLYGQPSDAGESVQLTRDGQPVGMVQVLTPPVAQAVTLQAGLAASYADQGQSGGGVMLLIQGLRACVPQAADLDDDACWRLIRDGGGPGGPLADAIMRRGYGVSEAESAPDPT